MKIYFITEDQHGPYFIRELLRKKQAEGLFQNVIITAAKKVPVSPKLDRVITTALHETDRIIIMVDADGGSIPQKKAYVEKFIAANNLPYVGIVILTHEIEDWICYSMNISIGDKKPSSILKQQYGYKKSRLKHYASKIDCQRLSRCESYQNFESFLTRN